IEEDDLIITAKNEINQRLQDIEGEFLKQKADLRFSSPEFRRITESLRALVGKENTFEIEENGLGYNNLLYIATVLGELQQDPKDTDLAALLIEEPEAHLHPHLQTLLMDYLQSCSSTQEESEAIPARVSTQIFVTTHSPTLASHVDLDSINVLYLDRKAEIRACPVRNCSLDAGEKDDLRRYLDVTKAQLFFARSIIFVEGISEALLLPEFGRKIQRPLDQYAVSIVNIQSLAFKPFAKIFQGSGLKILAAIITDADPPSGRAEDLKSEFENETLKIFIAKQTLEYDLALAGNAKIMAEVYKTLRPQKGEDMEKAINESQEHQQQAKAFENNFDKKDKARFAQCLAKKLSELSANDFQVPEYIQDAIKHVVGG
ncbi:MAG: AAA family ATPase, partial [Candidatus Micrarchaeota archaeon]